MVCEPGNSFTEARYLVEDLDTIRHVHATTCIRPSIDSTILALLPSLIGPHCSWGLPSFICHSRYLANCCQQWVGQSQASPIYSVISRAFGTGARSNPRTRLNFLPQWCCSNLEICWTSPHPHFFCWPVLSVVRVLMYYCIVPSIIHWPDDDILFLFLTYIPFDLATMKISSLVFASMLLLKNTIAQNDGNTAVRIETPAKLPPLQTPAVPSPSSSYFESVWVKVLAGINTECKTCPNSLCSNKNFYGGLMMFRATCWTNGEKINATR